MDSFWSKLLILGIVAAIGLFFIGNVYAPQREAQEAMAMSTQQSVNAVKLGVEGTESLVDGNSVISTVMSFCKPGNEMNIIIQSNGIAYEFKESAVSLGGHSVESVVDEDKYYFKTISSQEIRFVEQ